MQHRTTWTDESLEAELRRLIEKVGHFPSSSEMRANGRNDIACAVSRHGGFLAWCKKLGGVRLASDSDFGWEGEIKAANMFEAHGFSAARSTAPKSPHDLLVDEVLRVDVKSANYAEYGLSRGWFFRVGKLPQADLIFFLQVDTGNFHAVPWYASPQTNATFSKSPHRTMGRYFNNWGIIRQMINLRTTERAILCQKVLEVA